MSMNLCFSVVGGAGYVDFPIQTPTDLTQAVLEVSDDKSRLMIIENTLRKWGWDYDDRKELMLKIKALFENPNLILVMI